MTTVAYARGHIAADTGMCIADTRTGETRKIARTRKGLAGGAGTAGWVARFLEWFDKGERGHVPAGDENEEFLDRGMIIRPGKPKVIEVWEPEGMFEVDAEYYCLGTGREIGLAVMWHGGTPVEAVQCAMLHNTQTWGHVQTFSFMRQPARK